MATERRKVIVQYTADTRGYNRALRNIDRSAAQSAKSLSNLNKQVSALRSGFALAAKGVGAYFTALQALRGVSLAVGFLSDIERLDVSLQAASGSLEEYGRNLSLVRGLADEFGVSQRVLQDQFTRFVAAGDAVGLTFENVAFQFRALATTAAAFQLSGAQIEGIVLGWQQSMGSATINMEDLRQVADRIPGGLALATQAFREMTGRLNVTTKDFKDFVAEGEVGIEFLREFARILQEAFAEQAEAGAKTLASEVQRLKDEFRELGRELQPVVSLLADFTRFVRDAIIDARQLAGNLPEFEDVLQIDLAKASAQELDEAERVLKNGIRELERNVKPPLFSLGGLFGNLDKDLRKLREAQKLLEQIDQTQAQRAAAEQGVGAAEARLSPDLRGSVNETIGATSEATDKQAKSATDLKDAYEELEQNLAKLERREKALNNVKAGSAEETLKQIEAAEKQLQYQEDYIEALGEVGASLKSATEAERLYAEAEANRLLVERELTKAQRDRISSLNTLQSVQNRLSKISQPTERKGRETAVDRRFREIFSDDVNIRNVALKTRELGQTIGNLPVDQAAAKIEDFVGRLEKLRETATKRWDQLAVQDAIRRVGEISREVQAVQLGETFGSQRGIDEFAGAAAIPEITPKLEIEFSEESIELGLAAIEAASAQNPPKITAEVDVKFPDVVDLGDFEFEQTLGGQREES